jgi:hypothetical protein
MKRIVEIDDANFEREVLKSSQPVLVEFATGWSLPSVMFDGSMDEIANEFVEDLKLATVKLDRIRNSDCGTVFNPFRQFCISSMAKPGSGFLGPRARRRSFPN